MSPMIVNRGVFCTPLSLNFNGGVPNYASAVIEIQTMLMYRRYICSRPKCQYLWSKYAAKATWIVDTTKFN